MKSRIVETGRLSLHMLLLTGLATVSLGSCSTWDKLNKTERGAIIGGGTGAVIGGAGAGTEGALIGGAAGAVGGGLLGHELDDDDDDRHYRRGRRR